MAIARVMVDRHQLDGSDTEFLQVVDGRLARQRFVGAALRFGDAWHAVREAPHVHLIDDRVVPRRSERPVGPPGKRRVDDRAERSERGVVAIVEGEVRVRIADAVAEHLVAPPNRTRHGLGVRIHDNLVGVESMAILRIVRSVYTITVELVRPDIRKETVPHLSRPLG